MAQPQALEAAEIFHVASREAWEQTGPNYRGDTLGSEGFIHCSTAQQVLPVANLLFQGRVDLVLLTIAPEQVQAEIRYENLEGGTELFPHIYGPLDRAAVVSVETLKAGADGSFVTPPSLARRT